MGFEPTLEFPLNTLSKRAPSATRPSLRHCYLNHDQKLGKTSLRGWTEARLNGSRPKSTDIDSMGMRLRSQTLVGRPRNLRCRNSSDEVFLFSAALGADGKCIENSERQGKAQGLILTVAHVALAKNFHSDHGLT